MSTPDRIEVSVSRQVPGPAGAVYDLISDITTMSRYSPETVEARWLEGATTAAVGARFRGVNAIGRMRWTTKPVVTVAERGHCFAFHVHSGARSTWTYDLTATEGGTLVTESLSTERPVPALIRLLTRWAGVQDRSAHLRAGMQTTLEALAAAAAPVRLTTAA